MPLYAFGDHVPDIHPSAYVHPDAVVIGRVTIGPESTVWPGAVLRGDFGDIRVGARSSIQDGTVLHTTVEWPTVVGDECVVGHNAHLEGCRIEDRCLIGSGSVVLNRARVGTGSVVGAQALVTEGAEVPAGSMALGVPARIRSLDADQQRTWIDFAVREYVDNGRDYREQLRLLGPHDDRHRPQTAPATRARTTEETAMTTAPTRPESQGRPALELSDEELEQQGKHAHGTRNWVFLHGSAEQFATHTARMLELEQEYLRRYPKRTWQGSGGAVTEDSEVQVLRKALRGILVQLEALLEPPARADDGLGDVDDPTTALLRRIADAPAGRMNKLEVHQLAREVGLDRMTLARLYQADPPLLQTDRQDRVITDAGRERVGR